MEAIVDQALGHVFLGDSGGFLERAQVDDALVRDSTTLAGVEDVVVPLEPLGDVVGVEYCDLGRAAQAIAAHQGDVGPGDRQNRRRTPGSGGDGRIAAVAGTEYAADVAGKMIGQVGTNADRADSGAATTVWNTEGLVQIQMTHVGVLGDARDADQSVHVGAVQVDLAAGRSNPLTDLDHVGLEHAVGRGVGDHQSGQLLAMLLNFHRQIVQVDVALGVAADYDDAEASHMGAGRIGAVRRGWNQADVAMAFPLRFLPAANRQQAGIFALATGIGLQRDRGEAGDFAQHALEVVDHGVVAASLVVRAERVQLGELGPGHRDHLDRCVELHRA